MGEMLGIEDAGKGLVGPGFLFEPLRWLSRCKPDAKSLCVQRAGVGWLRVLTA